MNFFGRSRLLVHQPREGLSLSGEPRDLRTFNLPNLRFKISLLYHVAYTYRDELISRYFGGLIRDHRRCKRLGGDNDHDRGRLSYSQTSAYSCPSSARNWPQINSRLSNASNVTTLRNSCTRIAPGTASPQYPNPPGKLPHAFPTQCLRLLCSPDPLPPRARDGHLHPIELLSTASRIRIHTQDSSVH